MISIRRKIESDVEFLQVARTQNFQNVPFEKIEELVGNKMEYKQSLIALEEHELYSSFKFQLHELCNFKLPFRIIEVVKSCVKKNQNFPSSLSGIPIAKQFLRKYERQEALSQLKQKLIAGSLSHQEALRIVESIHWVHGTNSAILPMLPYNDYTMLSTGELLNKGIAPMCGELTKGGMNTDGINQEWISVETIRNLPRSWKYAASVSNSFNPSKFENAEQFFTETLEHLKKISPDDSSWDVCVISLLQLKQWNPELFKILISKLQESIDQLIHEAVKKTGHLEGKVLETLQYPVEELKKASHDEQSRKEVESKYSNLPYGWYKKEVFSLPIAWILEAKYHDYGFIRCGGWHQLICCVIDMRLYGDERIQELKESALKDEDALRLLKNLQKLCGEEPKSSDLLQLVKEKIEKRILSKQCSSAKRILRLKAAFNKDINVKISEEEKVMITSPFPILIASTKTKCFFLNGDGEAQIASAKWGDEVDVLFVEPKDMLAVKSWLEKQELTNKVQVHSSSLISSLFDFPLCHTPSDVIGENTALSSSDYKFIHEHIQSLLPLYQKKGYEHHGVAHATRAAYFAAVITEMYLAQGYRLATRPQNLPIAGFLHDIGRANDFGEDLWDADSGKICEEFAADKLKLPSQEVDVLSKSISEKDREPSISLEQKIIHDADCIEIIRCLLGNPDAFECGKLWISKDQFPKPLFDLFIREARSVIVLTEQPIIKKFLQNSSDPLRSLLQIVEFAKNFSFLGANTYNARILCSPSDYLLTPEVERAINGHLSH